MKNSLILTMLISIIFLSNSCKQTEVSDSSEVISINFDKPQKNALLFSSFVDSVRYIVLKTAYEDPIGEVNKIKYFNNKYYLLEKSTSIIYIFDSKGNYINKINRKGRGPGEYLSITEFDFDYYQHKLFIFDNGSRKIFTFSLDGELESFVSMEKGYLARDFAVISNGDFVFYKNDFESEEYPWGIWLVDRQGKFKKYLYQPSLDYKLSIMSFNRFIVKFSRDSIGVMNNNDIDEILHISKNGIKTKIKFDVDIDLSDELKSISPSEMVNTSEEIISKMYGRFGYFETDRYIFASYKKFSLNWQSDIIYDKVKRESIRFSHLENDIDTLYAPFLNSDIDSRIYSVIGDYEYLEKDIEEFIKNKIAIEKGNSNLIVKELYLKK